MASPLPWSWVRSSHAPSPHGFTPTVDLGEVLTAPSPHGFTPTVELGEVLTRLEVGADVLADGRVRAAPRLNGSNSARLEGLMAGQKLTILFGRRQGGKVRRPSVRRV
jgi:hypothetical protein